MARAGTSGLLIAIGLFTLGLAPARAQAESVPILDARIVSGSLIAVNYPEAAGRVELGLRGTALQPRAEGRAKIEPSKRLVEIEVKAEGLDDPRRFGREFQTFVLWALTPEGRPSNLGELRARGGKGKLETTTELTSFGLLVTAEPHFAVTLPSRIVVLENVIREPLRHGIDIVEARYELLERGDYADLRLPPGAESDPSADKVPEIAQARLAVAIARSAGAERSATEPLRKAEGLLASAERALRADDREDAAAHARKAIQTAEDARLIAKKVAAEERLAAEQRLAAASLAAADAERERAERRELEALRLADAAAQAHAEAEQARAVADQRVAQAELEKQSLRREIRAQLERILVTRETARGLVVDLPDVLFEVDRAELAGRAREVLAKLAGVLLAHPGLRIEIEGHTDSTGSSEHNLRLSRERAAAVQSYLIAEGVPAESLEARGFGEITPIASNDTAEGRSLNRRVEVILSGDVIAVELSRLQP